MMGYNRTCRLADFAMLAADFCEVYPHEVAVHPDYPTGQEYRKSWEITQIVRGLRDFGALHPHARLLGVGAGHEWTIYYLTTRVEQVFATDLYLAPNFWDEFAPAEFMSNPGKYAPAGAAWNPQRLVVQHADGRALPYPDGFFDGVFSASSIEHFGTLDEITQAAREMGRVLKPGGVLALATEFKLGGPAGDGWGNVVVFDPETLHRHIIEPSGCEMVDAADYDTDDTTLATKQGLDWVVTTAHAGKVIPAPHIVLEHLDYIFTSASVVGVKS
jgi:SAM-dependent methyltransferase